MGVWGPRSSNSAMSMKSKQGRSENSREMKRLSMFFSGERIQDRCLLNYSGILSMAPEKSRSRHRSPSAPRRGVISSTTSLVPHSKDLYHTPEDLSGENSGTQAGHLSQHTVDSPRGAGHPRTPLILTSKLGSTKIASVRSRMRKQAHADVYPDGRNADGCEKGAGAHAPAAPPPQAARPVTRSA